MGHHPVTCDPGANEFIRQTFGDCIYNVRDMVGFIAGLASICCWLVAQMPQLYRNYKTQSAEALSPWFLAEWLLGDTFNLLGAMLKGDQLPTVVFTAQYFICVDAVMLVQYLYYMSLQRRRERMLSARRHRHPHHHHRRHTHHHQHAHAHSSSRGPGNGSLGGQQQQQHEHAHSGSGSEREGRGPAAAALPHEHGDEDAEIVGSGSGSHAAVPVVVAGGTRDVSFRPQRVLPCLGVLLLVAHMQPGGQQQQQEIVAAAAAGAAASAGQQASAVLSRRRLLQAAGAALGSGSSSGYYGAGVGVLLLSWSYTAGTVLGYCSSVLYLTSRVSQIWKNHKRQSAEGLAISMFLCAIAANSLYGASIIIRSYNWQELSSSLPWLIGSLGTVALDLTIYAQSRMLGQGSGQKHHPSDEDEPLLLP